MKNFFSIFFLIHEFIAVDILKIIIHLKYQDKVVYFDVEFLKNIYIT